MKALRKFFVAAMSFMMLFTMMPMATGVAFADDTAFVTSINAQVAELEDISKVEVKTSDSQLVLDGYEVFRSTKRYSGYGTTCFFDTKNLTYNNTKVDIGKRYFYKVRGYVVVNGERYYTPFSTKAYRKVLSTAKNKLSAVRKNKIADATMQVTGEDLAKALDKVKFKATSKLVKRTNGMPAISLNWTADTSGHILSDANDVTKETPKWTYYGGGGSTHSHWYAINPDGSWKCTANNHSGDTLLADTDNAYITVLKSNGQPGTIYKLTTDTNNLTVGAGHITKDGNKITYTNTNTSGTAQNVVIRTTNLSDELIVNAPLDTVSHYDSCGSVSIIETASSSFHEHGKVPFVEISKGRIALEKGAEVKKLHFNTKTESLNETKDAVSAKANDKFDEIIVAADSSVKLPEFSRDEVKIGSTGTLVVELQDDTNNDENTNKDYIWLYKQGTIAQMVATNEKVDGIKKDSESGEFYGNKLGDNNVPTDDKVVVALGVASKTDSTKKAAVEIANNYSGNNTVGTITITEGNKEQIVAVPKLDVNGDLEVVAGVTTADIAEKLGEGKTVEDVLKASATDIADAVAIVPNEKKPTELQGKTGEAIKEIIKEIIKQVEVKEKGISENEKAEEKETTVLEKTLGIEDYVTQIGAGETFKFAATDDKVVWSSSDETIGKIDTDGTFTAVKAGTVTVTATLGEKKVEKQVTVTLFHGGDGTEKNLYLVANKEQFLKIESSDKGMLNYKLQSNIELGEEFSYVVDEEESYYIDKLKNVCIDGEHHIISTRHYSYFDGEDPFVFGILSGHVILKNLTVCNGMAIVYEVYPETNDDLTEFINVKTVGTTSGSDNNNSARYVAYLSSKQARNINFVDCDIYSNIIGSGFVGGYIGEFYFGSGDTNLSFIDCDNFGNIISTSQNAAASMFISNPTNYKNNLKLTIKNCSNKGKIVYNGNNPGTFAFSLGGDYLPAKTTINEENLGTSLKDIDNIEEKVNRINTITTVEGFKPFKSTVGDLPVKDGKFEFPTVGDASRYELIFSFSGKDGANAGYKFMFNNELPSDIEVSEWLSYSETDGNLQKYNKYDCTYYTYNGKYVYNEPKAKIGSNINATFIAYNNEDNIIGVFTYTYE